MAASRAVSCEASEFLKIVSAALQAGGRVRRLQGQIPKRIADNAAQAVVDLDFHDIGFCRFTGFLAGDRINQHDASTAIPGDEDRIV